MPTHSVRLGLLSHQYQKHYQKRKLKTDIHHEYRYEIIHTILAIQIQQCL